MKEHKIRSHLDMFVLKYDNYLGVAATFKRGQSLQFTIIKGPTTFQINNYQILTKNIYVNRSTFYFLSRVFVRIKVAMEIRNIIL